MKKLSALLIMLAVAMGQTAHGVEIDLPLDGTYGHPLAYDNDDPGFDDTADDAYYQSGSVLKNEEKSPIYAGWMSGEGFLGDDTAWHVWAFNAPVDKEIEGFDFQTQVHCETTVTNSTWTWYYTTDAYDGLADPDTNSWTQFAQVGYADSGTLAEFTGIAFDATTNTVYVAVYIDRVVNDVTAKWWDDQQQVDSYEFHFAKPVVELVAPGTNTTASYGHPVAYDNDDPGFDDKADDAYYQSGSVLKNEEKSAIYAGWSAAGPLGDDTAWHVWAYEAPGLKQIEGFDFQTQVHCETTVTNSTWTWYYTTDVYDGLADPDTNSWTQFAQVGYADSGALTPFPDIEFDAAADRVYVAVYIDRVVNDAAAVWWDDQLQVDSYVFDLAMPVVKLDAPGTNTTASYGHPVAYDNDDPGFDDTADDAYYQSGSVLKNEEKSAIYAGWSAAGPLGDDTAWHVWAFEAPGLKQIEGFDFQTQVHCETTVTGSTWTWYYTTDAYDGSSDPTPGSNGWTQFAQVGYADSGTLTPFPDIEFDAAADRVYVAVYIDRVVNGGGTANWWDDQQQVDSYVFDLAMPVIDLTAYTNSSGAYYDEHELGYPNDDPGGDDMADDAYYQSGSALKNEPKSPIYAGWAAAPTHQLGDDTAWHVWAYDAPDGKLIEKLNHFSEIYCETTVTNTTWTWYYTVDPYAGTSDPVPGSNGWTQFAQMGYADSGGGVKPFLDVTFAPSSRVYVGLYIDRVVNGGGTANWWDDQQQQSSTEFYFVSDTTEIIGLSPYSSGVVKMVLVCGSPATTYPLKKTDLVYGGSWGNVGHSATGVAPFETNSLLHAGTEGTNLVIYLESTDPAAFFSLGE